MHAPIEKIEEALEVLSLPKLINKAEIRKQYHFLAKKFHPDVGGSEEDMENINQAYAFLMKYIEEFRYTFDEEELAKQYPGVDYAQRFRP